MLSSARLLKQKHICLYVPEIEQMRIALCGVYSQGKTTLPWRYHLAHLGVETEAYQTGHMKVACQIAPNRMTFNRLSLWLLFLTEPNVSVTLKPSGSSQAAMWNGNHVVFSLILMSETSPQEHTYRSQTAVILAQIVEAWSVCTSVWKRP